MSTISTWVSNARSTSVPQSFMPSLLAICLALPVSGFSWWLSALALLGVVCGHLGLNLFDDYFDYRKKKSDYRDELVHEGFRARIGKCIYITSGQTTVEKLLVAAIAFCAVALAAGSVIFYFRGIFVLYIVLAAVFLGLSYSAPPLRLSYHGMGELVIGLMFGPMNMIGSYYAACGTIDSSIIFISVPVGLLVMNIVYVHSIMDFIPDKKIGKSTFAVLLNSKPAMLIALTLILTAPFIIIAAGILTHNLSSFYWLVFLALPMAYSLLRLMMEFAKNPDKKFTPRFWMGPMGNWEHLEQAGIDWFMIRWLSARNLLSFFCLIIIISAFLYVQA